MHRHATPGATTLGSLLLATVICSGAARATPPVATPADTAAHTASAGDQSAAAQCRSIGLSSCNFAHLTRREAAPDACACVWQLIRSLQRKPGVKPGALWSYNTGGAWLVGRRWKRPRA